MGRNRLADELKKRVDERNDYSIAMLPSVEPYKSIAKTKFENSANIQASVDHIKRQAVKAYCTNDTVLMDACINEIIKLAKNTRKSIMVSERLCIIPTYYIDELCELERKAKEMKETE